MSSLPSLPSLAGFAEAPGTTGSQCCQSTPVTRELGMGPSPDVCVIGCSSGTRVHARTIPPPPPKCNMASHGGTGRRGGARSAGRGPKKRKVHEIAQVLCAIPFFKWIHFLIYLFTITLNHLLLWAKYRIASLCRPTQFINIVDNWIVQVICNCIVIYRQL